MSLAALLGEDPDWPKDLDPLEWERLTPPNGLGALFLQTGRDVVQWVGTRFHSDPLTAAMDAAEGATALDVVHVAEGWTRRPFVDGADRFGEQRQGWDYFRRRS